MDFLSAFGIGVNFATRRWFFVEDPRIKFEFEAGPDNSPLSTHADIENGEKPAPPLVTPRENFSRNESPSIVNGDRMVPDYTPKTTRKRARIRSKRCRDRMPFCCGLIELASEEQQRLDEFLQSEIVGDPTRPGETTLTEHRIDVANHVPIKQRYYPVSPKIQEAIYAEVDKMLEAGIIEPSKSEWSTPIVMIEKQNGSYRFCLDFRKLNAVSKKDAYPLPYMNAILDKLRSAQYISTIDLSQAYFQIPLEQNSRELTAFTVPGKELFHLKRMPYGLTGAPATFQRLLDRLIRPEMDPHAFAYLDDIVIVTKTFEEHLQWLKRVLERIREAGSTRRIKSRSGQNRAYRELSAAEEHQTIKKIYREGELVSSIHTAVCD
ncbi:polyprotein [Lasius niger]|uniref:Polyprotein n=1 Tax=Lasius niger TaxID=67767 RepID=A0A0J7K159_LASNI|nr:polyprotein [Lasius niger]